MFLFEVLFIYKGVKQKNPDKDPEFYICVVYLLMMGVFTENCSNVISGSR